MTEELESIIDMLKFQLTRPTRVVTYEITIKNQDTAFQLTRPTRGVTWHDEGYQKLSHISTHTPHAGRDLYIIL